MLQLDPQTRSVLWKCVVDTLERYAEIVDDLPVAPELDIASIRDMLNSQRFDIPASPEAAIRFVSEALNRYQVHTPHRRYYGLFNPAPATMGIAADALVAGYNPQLAAWSHSPFAVEVERHLVHALGERLGYDRQSMDGTFTSGGMEANHTAVLTALTAKFPEFASGGVRALPGQPILYASGESHHSLKKAARVCGLGLDAVREVPVDD